MFYCLSFNKVPSKAFMISLGDSCLIMLKKTLCAHEIISNFYPASDFGLIRFADDLYTHFLNFHISLRIFGGEEVWLAFRSLQTILFLTDSVFNA